MKTWITHSFDKVIVDMPAPEKLEKELALYLTKGGKSGCHVVVNCDADTSVSLKAISPDGVRIKLYSEDHVHEIKGHQYVDPIVPYEGEVLTAKVGLSLPFYVDIEAEDAGDHTVSLVLCDGDGNAVEALTARLHVWSFALPTEKAFATSVGINRWHISRFEPEPDAHKSYYDLLLEDNICGHNLPYDILDPRADAYLSDPKVTSFVIGLWEAKSWTDEKITQYYNKVSSNPEWLKKAIIYVIDEPSTEEALAQYKEICERFSRLCPGIGVISPFYTNKQMGDKMDQVDAMAPCTTLWCPKLCLWDDNLSYTPFLNYTPEKSFGERFKDFQKRGDTVWGYVCNAPLTPYSQLFIDTEGLMQRLMIWQHYQRDITGFLYWGTTSWGYHGNDGVSPWETAYNGVKGCNPGEEANAEPVYGEGFLLYPGSAIGRPGAIGSIRMKILRDALDDVELIVLGEKLLGKEWVMARVDEATPNLTTYTSAERFIELRKEIGDAIEAALK